jgi:hypothetical protein
MLRGWPVQQKAAAKPDYEDRTVSGDEADVEEMRPGRARITSAAE